MIAKKILAAFGIAMLLAACDSETTHTAAWYREHPDELKAQLAKCKDDPGRLRNTPNCVNAAAANDPFKKPVQPNHEGSKGF